MFGRQSRFRLSGPINALKIRGFDIRSQRDDGHRPTLHKLRPRSAVKSYGAAFWLSAILMSRSVAGLDIAFLNTDPGKTHLYDWLPAFLGQRPHGKAQDGDMISQLSCCPVCDRRGQREAHPLSKRGPAPMPRAVLGAESGTGCGKRSSLP